MLDRDPLVDVGALQVVDEMPVQDLETEVGSLGQEAFEREPQT